LDLRRSRYIGLAKTHLQHMLIAVSSSLKRVMVWFTHPQPTKPLERFLLYITAVWL
jgi:hypothetical protein